MPPPQAPKRDVVWADVCITFALVAAIRDTLLTLLPRGCEELLRSWLSLRTYAGL